MRLVLLALMLACVFPVDADSKLYFISPVDGAEIQGPVRVLFGLRGMGVAPAGVNIPNTGHHHLLVNTMLSDPSAAIPADENHIHFGAGQTEAIVELPPGTHTLQLVLGDHLHRPHNPPVMSEVIRITVK